MLINFSPSPALECAFSNSNPYPRLAENVACKRKQLLLEATEFTSKAAQTRAEVSGTARRSLVVVNFLETGRKRKKAYILTVWGTCMTILTISVLSHFCIPTVP